MNVKKQLLVDAMNALLLHNKELKRMADSGDCGFWKAEELEEYKLAEKVIVELQEVLGTRNPKIGKERLQMHKVMHKIEQEKLEDSDAPYSY